MKIREMFAKSIDRPIKGVIKVGQDDQANVFEELDEYVVTRELTRHFRDFFANYRKGINGEVDEMGVWISGFFGSGKSHFLKILSYLLDNKEIDGKRAIDFFTEDRKIADAAVLANIKLAGSTNGDIILFNIDSKSVANARTNKDAIAVVFMKVFNEMLGYCGAIPFLAEFERKLDAAGQYEIFKAGFEKVSGMPWVEVREDFYFIQDDIIKTLVELNIMSEDAARNWCEHGSETYSLSIEQFARLVKAYCNRKGGNHHVVFLVDEIGQYIAEDPKLMLNLQTVTEDLGRICKGKAWVIVTSQQDIDSFTKVRGNDFSKILGRFDTRLSLSSANVDEVIRKRILQKTPAATKTLELLYDQKESVIKNLITFTQDTAEKKLYLDRADFAAVYPFVPYQFNLLGQVLTAIRLHGATGKHLAEGERSMLALFKESAELYKDSDEGVLIPFNVFFRALAKFIDHTHAIVISHAEENEFLEPFDVELLKVLFMIKYVKEIKGYPENLTSLMVSDIDEDRITLKKKVEDGLKRLFKQTLIQKNGDEYNFLTNEEQDINRSISQEVAEMGEIISTASAVIFDEVYKEKKYRYSNRYNFGFNQIVDDRFYKNIQTNDIGIKIITPYGEEQDDASLQLLSSTSSNVMIRLPADTTFLDEISDAIKIKKFLTKQGAQLSKTFTTIKAAKETELGERNERIRIFIEDALRHADIFVNGDKLNGTAKDPASRINEALGKLVAMRYHKLAYMETAPTVLEIENLFKNVQQNTLGIDKTASANQNALNDVQDTIALNSRRHIKTVMKTLMDKYSVAPYGFIDLDVQWLVASLFRNGRVMLSVNGKNIPLLDTDKNEIVRYLTKKEFLDKLVIENREVVPESQIKAVQGIIKEFFGMPAAAATEDILMADFLRHAGNLEYKTKELEVEYRIQPRLPGHTAVQTLLKLFNETKQYTHPVEFYRFVFDKQDDFRDLGEDMAPVFAFFAGDQKGIYDKALRCDELYEASKSYVTDKELISTVNEIRVILRKPMPFGEIYKLPSLIERFAQLHVAILGNEAKPVLTDIESDRKAVFTALANKPFEREYSDRYTERFDELRKKVESADGVADIKSAKFESDALKVRCIDEIAEAELREAARTASPEQPQAGETEAVPPKPAPKKVKNISIKQMLSSSTRMESEADIDAYVENLRTKLKQELEGSDTINVIL